MTMRATSVFVDGAEQFGFILYGLWPESVTPDGTMGLEGLAMHTTDLRYFRLSGDSWEILCVECAFDEEHVYRATLAEIDRWLQALLSAGARVAWLGSEGLPFADPPNLFTSEWMEGGVLAARTSTGVSISGVKSDEFAPLSNEEMRQLEEEAAATYLAGSHRLSDQ
ncbi:hypothetical protein SAMN05428970_3031 [Agromyces sp. CF514]|uniref:hypothetical protein n=1 Tax=Agromyces sp. CF514 TaxID=1881031 RepID=UPI0008EA55E3|nr:hypothetical protein [Agromyces sp. CF514]SFR84644.1 hypothetical protein SAMN05428970_3031 [Agromyces sp. CF514]